MPLARAGGRAADEHGVTLILVALCMVALLLAAAAVLDLGLVRQNRQADKSATDFAAAAGIRGLENPAGVPQPWQGVCAARDYLVANNDELASMTGSYANGDGTTTYASNPCDDRTATPFTNLCSANKATWAAFTGLADGGRIRVIIKSGYVLPDPEFPEDGNAIYATDLGNPAHAGCDQLAVIIEEGEEAQFGEIAGATGYATRIRSVSRIEIGDIGNATPALLFLEQRDCRVLAIGGTSGAKVIVEGVGDNPGIIHADSLGDGAGCDPADAQNGNIFQVDGNPPDPRIIARRAVTPVGGEAAGVLSAVALSDEPGAVPAVVSSPWPVEVCAAQLATDCGTGASVTGIGPRAGRVVTRGPIDDRYREPIIGLREAAEDRFAWDDASDLPAGWTAVACGAPGPFAASKVWVDCDGGEFQGSNRTFEASVEEIVIDGYVVVGGGGSVLRLEAPSKVFIKGHDSLNAVQLLGNDNEILVNDGGLADSDGDGFACDERYADDPLARTELVIGSGPIVAEGADGKVLRMCQTTVFMMDDSGAPGCPIPSEDGVAPYDNGCRGRIRVAGNNRLDWSAPNVNNLTTPTRAQLDQFEDLAFWSETQGSGGISAIEGSGGVRLSGIFFTPNAAPFRVGGNGAYDIQDAQFITRRLEVAGNGVLLMRPQPQNAVEVPIFGDFSLVR